MQITILDYFHVIYFILINILQYWILLAQFYNKKNIRLESWDLP